MDHYLKNQQEKYHPLESTFIICKGHSDKMDLSMYHTSANSYLSFLTFSWGIIADIDIESEMIRFLGVLRNDIWALWRVLFLRSYKAKFSYLLSQDQETTQTISQGFPSSVTEAVPSHWRSMESEFVLFWASHVSHAAYNVIQSPHSTLRDGIFRIMIVRYVSSSPITCNFGVWT
jgi:sphingosine kinase